MTPEKTLPINDERVAQYGEPMVTYLDDLNSDWFCARNDFDDPDLSDRGLETARGEMEDLDWYMRGLKQYVPTIRKMLTPIHLEDSIINVLQTFDGSNLIRATRWYYNLTFLEALGQIENNFNASNKLERNPLLMLSEDIAKGLEKSKTNITWIDGIMNTRDGDERSRVHTFDICISGVDLTITGPKDLSGFKNAIWAEFFVASGNNLAEEIAKHGWKYQQREESKHEENPDLPKWD